MTLEERSELRKQKLVAHQAINHEDAEYWDLVFWQSLSPEDRLSALLAIHKDVEKAQKARTDG